MKKPSVRQTGSNACTLTYHQELDVDHIWATSVYALATVTRTGIDQQTQGKFALTVDVKSEVPIVDLGSPSHGASSCPTV